MREPPALIVHPDKKHQRLVQRIFGASGFAAELVEDLARAKEIVDSGPLRVLAIDGELAASPEGQALILAAFANGTNACVTLVHPTAVLADELTVAAHKLARNDLFGAEKYLLWGTELTAVTITRATQRAFVIEQLADDIRARGQTARVVQMAMLVADELISNAVHNAPVDDAGVHYRRDVARDIEIELDERHQVQLRWGSDARFLALEVTDRFGSLDRPVIMRALHAKQVRETGGGAGMGISLAYRSSAHLVFDIAPRRRTEIIALMDLRYSPSERVPVSSYNVFVEREEPR